MQVLNTVNSEEVESEGCKFSLGISRTTSGAEVSGLNFKSGREWA